MRAGLPLVAADVNGGREAVADGSTGFLVAAGNVAMFRHRLEQLLQDDSLRERLGIAGRGRFEKEFTVEAMLRRTAAVYRSAAMPVAALQAERPVLSSPASSRPTVTRQRAAELLTAADRVLRTF